MKGKIIGATLLVGALLSGCGSNSANVKKEVKLTPLSLKNVPESGSIKSSKNATFTIKGTSSKGAKISLNDGTHTIAKNGKFTIEINVPYDESSEKYVLTAKAPKMKLTHKSITIHNNTSGYKARMAKESSQDAADARKASIGKKAEAKAESIKAEQKAKEAAATAAKKKAAHAAKINSEYPTVSSEFGTGKLTSLSDGKLMSHGVRVTSEIIDLGADGMSNYHVLLKANGTYVLMVEDHSKTGKLAQGDTITVYGMFNGKGRINENQINSGISSSYYTEPCVLLMADKVVNHDE